jgi:hypothetical protein
MKALNKLSMKVQDIVAARRRIGDAIYHSPCPRSLSLSRLCGSRIYCKLDHLQMTGSFYDRHFGPADVARVSIEFILETRDFRHIQQVREVLGHAEIDAVIE